MIPSELGVRLYNAPLGGVLVGFVLVYAVFLVYAFLFAMMRDQFAVGADA